MSFLRSRHCLKSQSLKLLRICWNKRSLWLQRRERKNLKTSKTKKFVFLFIICNCIRMKSQSTTSLSQSLYGSLPRSLKQDLIVKSRVEDPDVLAERRAVVASKSVSELSQITSISDFPVPKTLSRAFHKSMEMLASSKPAHSVEDEESR